MATVSLNGLHHWSQWTVFTLYGIVTLCLIGGKVAQAEVCDFTHDSRTNPEDIFLSTYEERPVDETLIALDVEGTIGTSGNIKLEIDDTIYLKLDEKNITWKVQYDLDTIEEKQVTVKVDCYELSNSFKIKSINIYIDIYDINDNDPFFIGGPYVLNISELWPPGIVIFDGVEADDNDIDTSSTELIYSYEAEGFGDFVFTPKEELMIAPAGLDYETRSFYNVTLFVKNDSDNSTARTGISYLFINVLDGDDQNPVFGSTHYSATVIEEVSGVTLDVNPPIYAYDPDFGLNETIIYSFANPQNLLDYEKLESDNFRINTTTGEITIIHAVDKENQTDDIFIRVRAAQKDQPAYRYNFILVVVSVIDVNDNAPVMGMSNYTGIITEDSPIGAFVSEFGATDNDQGTNAVFEFVLIPDDVFTVETVSDGRLTLGQVKVKDKLALDADNGQTYYNLTVYAVETQTTEKRKSFNSTVYIQIVDVNDNSPVFDHSAYVGTIIENATTSEIVSLNVRISASDADIGVDNSAIIYSILSVSNDGDTIFGIDASTGIIYVNDTTELDADKVNSYVISVVATDKGDSPRSGITNVLINVLDVDDEPPEFQFESYTASVSEAVVINSSIIQIQAFDVDSEGALTYGISDNQNFSVSSNGIILTAANLDRETQDIYTVTLTATDGNLVDTTELTITVTDANDNAPEFNATEYAFDVVEGLDNQLIGSVYASDIDEGINADISFEFLPPYSTNGLFVIDNNGAITTATELDREAQDVHVIYVVAADGGLSSRSSAVPVTINILDINDNLPVFTLDNYQVTVDEGSGPVGSVFLTVEATDADLSPNDDVMYYINSGNHGNHFDIDNSTGGLSVISAIDVETEQSQFIIEITVYNTEPYVGNQVMNNTVNVTVNIQDINDEAPAFANNTYSVTILEQLPSQSSIFQITATDLDFVSRPSDFVYWISGGDEEGKFSIHPTQGDIIVIGDIDSDSPNNNTFYNLTVSVTDRDSTTNNDTATVLITVIDINDNDPQFSEGSYSFPIDEDADITTFVGMVTATDKDEGTNGDVVRYTIIDGDGTFQINETTGKISVNQSLDYENGDEEFIYLISAEDALPRTGTTTVTISVQNINDAPPVFVTPEYNYTVYENSRPGISVGYIEALDPDGDNLSYSLNDTVNNAFSMDSNTGLITVSGTGILDREELDRHTLVVLATDGVYIATSTVTVAILDENDNSPKFEKSVYYGNVTENTFSNATILQVLADDLDIGANADIIYSILATSSHGDDRFSIDGDSGDISVQSNADLDYELVSSYVITVQAVDNPTMDTQQRSSVVTVYIDIIDINDVMPEFADSSYVAYVNEAVAMDTSVIQIQATDEDTVGMLQYSIADSTDTFIIENKSAIVKTNCLLDREVTDAYFMIVTVHDGIHSNNVNLTVYIEDTNDNSPQFDTSLYIFNISEGINGTNVGTVHASDLDNNQNGEITYSFQSSDDERFFSIDQGIITTGTELDREAQDVHVIYVIAADGGLSSRSSAVPVTINILDINDNLPVFTLDNYQITVDEGSGPVGSVFLTVEATDADLSPNDDVMYYISSGNHGNHFDIDNSTGGLSVISAIDVETEQSQFIIEITVYNTEPYVGNQIMNNTVNVTVNIQDINNNGPLFENTTYAISIPEDTELRSPILRLTATDVDTITSYFIYWISNGNNDGIFDINEDGDIIVIGDIDRDPPNNNVFFNLTVTVSDGDSNTDNDTTSVIIAISDVNDNSPVFSQETYRFTADEGVAVATSVGMVTATDKDEGTNGEVVSYAIMDGDGTFGIDETSGEISVNRSLDFENGGKEFRFTVVAHDGGLPQQNGSVSIVISINNTNDEEPAFIVSTYNFTAYENSRQGTPVGKVEATDPDHDILSYFIITSASLFTVDENSGQIIVSGSLDREVHDSYNVVVIATDGVYSTSTNITIAILDENDNSPIFMKSRYYGNVTEDVDIGTEILQVSAQDEDVGDNANVEYSILATSSNGDGIFGIHNSSGSLFILDNINVDYETTRSYVIVVQATDQPVDSFSRSSVVTVYIDIMDINDVTPEFSESSYVAYVNEAVAMDTSVIQIQASDVDTVGTLVYSVEGSDSFKVDNTSGIVKTVDLLDREMQDMYEVQLSVNDGIHSTSVNVTIYVEDNNDNSPVFEFNSYNFNISEGFTGLVVGMVNASDADLGINSEIQFSLPSPYDNNGLFDVDGDGVITTATELDREAQDVYVIYVVAADGGLSSRSSAVPVTINILDINDNLPVFTLDNYQVTVDEGSGPVGSVFLTVEATDIDLSPNDEVMYFISDGNHGNHFDIDNSTGELNVFSAIDFDEQSTIILEITAYNTEPYLGKEVMNNTANVTVNIQDINNNGPLFENATYTISIPEDTELRSPILRVTATDMDTITSYFIYWISNGNNDGIFDINEDGDIIVIGDIDRDPPYNYTFFNLTVTVSDGDSNTNNDTTNVQITISDVNDNSPVFEKVEYIFMVNENSTVGTIVGSVHATDIDDGSNGEILSYDIINGDDTFSMNNQTGNLMLTSVLDPSLNSQFTLTVSAMDGGSIPKTGSTVIIVTITDVNNNIPVFLSSNYSFTVYENSRSDTSVGKVSAIDSDDDVLSYFILNTVPFSIDEDTGVIKVISSLDRENVDSYNVVVMVTDGVYSASANATIAILDENDNSPIFMKSTYYGNVTEDVDIGMEILQVEASDVDLGGNADVDYSILAVSGNGDSIFGIHGNNGSIFILNNTGLDFELMNIYVISVQATDHPVDSESRSSVATVYISIEDMNDEMPLFGQSEYVAYINEEVTIATSVIQIQATDEDTVGVLAYSVHDDSSTFTVHNESAIVSTTELLDRESHDKYVVTISVTDGKFSNNVNLTVYIEDTNDNSPQFDTSLYIFNISEGINGTNVGTVHASDIDLGINADISYSFLTSARLFDIDGDGVITMATELDREAQDVYVIYVVAADGGLSSRSSAVPVTINILDINDNLPVFTLDNYQVTVDEGSGPVGSVFLTVEATDADLSPNDDVMYYISSGNHGNHFDIDNSTGGLSVISAIDVETEQSQFIIEITVYNTEPYVGNQIMNNTVNVTVNIQDINNNGPLFENTTYTISIPEDIELRSPILRVTATDMDTITSYFIYWISNGNNDGIFDINEDGDIIVIGDIDRDPPNNNVFYNLTISVSDMDGNTLNDSAIVKITIDDVNDNAPLFDQAMYEITVNETSSPGVVLTVLASDIDSGDNGMISRYSLDGDDVFSIDDISGNISLVDRLDYESGDVQFTYVVSAVDGGLPNNTGTVSLIITILNENDETPVFNSDSYSFTILENAVIDTFVGRVMATDADGDTIIYTVNPTDVPFVIDSETGDIIVSESGVLDRETWDNYRLIVTASDGLHDVNATVDVHLLDENDNTPEFPPNEYSGNMTEDEMTGFTVLQVVALDEDEGMNSNVTFSIITGNHGNAFGIMDDGSVFLANSSVIDIANYVQYSLTVQATDGGEFPRSSITMVIINILDVNNNPPVFQSDLYTVDVSEEQSAGIQLIQVIAVDADPDSVLLYSITDDSLPFTINNVTGEISTSDTLDRETTESWLLNVSCSDGLYEDYTIINVTVLDVNDNEPEFLEGEYKKTISEIFPVGNVILTVSATDADETNEMVYFLEDSNSKFAVNYQTGAITLQQIITGFDFGIQHTFSVKARDSGSPPKESSVQVTILINFNITANGTQEYPPFFNDTYSASVQEDIAFGSHIVTVQAFDVNVDDHSNLLYSIVGGSGANFFSIDKYSGEMKTSAPIDREIKNIFHVNVTATDPTGLTSVVTTVTITVEDVNDNSPEFTGLPYQTSITEGNITSDIFSVIADDDDEGANGDVVYGLSSFPSLFSIDNVTGMIFGLASLDREAPGLVINNNGEAVYELLVTAEDQGNEPLTSDIVVTVYVQDINDNPPVFTEDTYTADVPEDASADRSIITVSVTDNDWNNTITFSLQSDGNTNGAFTIDEMSGVVTLTGDGILDVRDNDFYNLTVEADDGLNTNQATILITVLEINLYNPVFNQSLGYVYSINENDYPGALSVVTVGSVWATDDDGDAIIYSIFAGNQDGIFVIDENGQISTNGTLNREDQDVYSLTIAAMDDRTSPRLGLVEVIVNILDVNDNDPVISSSDLTASISENVETGTQLLMTPTVFVSDADIAGNGDVTLRLEGAGSSDFLLVLNTDNTVTISVDGDIDRENKEVYDLLLIAEDGGSPSRSTNSTLKVNVLDINDNSPVFNETRYTASISEKQPSQTALNMNQPITAYDIDDSPYNFIIYAVESGSNQDKFRIDSLDGTIYAVQSFDYDAGDTEFNLTISAQNPGRSDVDVAVVTITVIDITETTTVVPSTPAPTTDTPEDYFNFLDEEDYDQTISSEISPSNETITQVIAVNPDGVSEGIFYNITNQTVQVYPKGPEVPASNFVIDPDTGIITLVEDLNGDIGLYELEITAWNGTESTTITVELIVVSPNNTAPHFKSPSYEAEITDTDSSGTDVVKVIADDDDAPVYGNGQIRFEVDEDNPITDYFQIDNTGMITVKKSLLPIVTFSVNFMVFVFDGGLPQLNDSTLVSVNITRQYGNLHTPVIVPPITSINLPENTAVNSIIHVVYAIDADSDINGEVFYDIQYVGSLSGNAMAAFDIDPLTGNITTISEFDFDKGSKYYQIMVYAEDKGYPSRKGYGVVGVTITDVNDEPPMFIQPVGTYHVTENVFNASVGVVMATDIDSGDNAYIEYSITGGNDGNEFTIIPETGELFTNVELDREENGMYTLTVTATNSKAAPHFMDAITMTISVDDVNDNAPEFFSYSSLVVIPMTTPVNDVITTVQANDTDLGANAAVFYMLSQGNDHFTVNRDSGDITTTVSLNNGEALQTFQLTVVAYDGGYPRLESSIDVTIKVLDYSTGQPTFTGIDVQEFIMPVAMENENPGSYSELIPAAYDPLDEDGNDIRYHIVAGNDDGYFMLDSVTRILTTLITLDRESILEHKLVIRATTVRNTTTTGRRKRDTDLGANEMYIVVPIGDSNDNKPVFQQDTYVKGIMDDIGYGSSVLQVEALDLDAGNFSLVWYYHDNTTTTSLFDIQRHAGVVNTADVFSDKSGDTYSFKVTARDNHGEGLYSDHPATVLVHVLTVNDLAVLTSELPPGDIIDNLQEILQELANLTGLIIDDSKVGPRVDGDQVYPDETDLWFYGIDPDTNEIVSAKDILDLISQSPQQPGDLDIDDFEEDWKVTEITEIYNKINKVPVSVSGIEAALFVLGIFILFASIFSIIAVFVWWEKREAERICKKAFWMDMYPLPLSGAGVENPAYLHVLAESHIGNTNAVDETDRATLDQGTTYVTRAGKTYKLGPDGEPVEVPTSDKLREPVYVEIGTSMSDDWIQARIVEGSLPNPLKEGMRDDGGYESQELTMDMFMDTSDFNDDVEAEDLLLRLESVEPVIVDNKGFIPDTGFSEGVPFTKV